MFSIGHKRERKRHKMRFKALLFDLDGTLADTLADLRDAMNGMLKEKGFPELTLEQTRKNICYGQKQFVTLSLGAGEFSDEFIKECEAGYSKYYARCFANTTCAYGGLHALLQDLQREGVKLAVVTNKAHEKALVIMEKLYGDIHFETILGVSAGDIPKPDPSLAHRALEVMGVEADRAAFIGDSDIDMQTAKNSGCFALGVLWGYRDRDCLAQAGADAFVADADELRAFLYEGKSGVTA